MAVPRKIYKFKYCIILSALLLCNNFAKSQSNYLYKKISVSFTEINLEKALEQISEIGGFTFSYNSKNFDEQRHVSLQIENKTVAKTLNQLFDNSVRYKVVGSHVILNKKNPPAISHADNRPNEYILTGYIVDSQTGEKIKEATVYEIDGRIVSLSNAEGFYSLTIPSEKDVNGLSYSKHGYMDTVIMVEPAYKKNFNIYLNPENIRVQKIESVNPKLENFHNRPMVDILVQFSYS
ncbi:STN domain-containing protein [Bacteroidota bacterium]